MLIAALSDTHMPDRARTLPEPLLDRLRTVDLILHAGDFTKLAILNHLRSLAPVEAVLGNVDEPALALELPRTRLVQVGRFRLGLVHGDGPGGGTTLERARRAFDRVDCIVFGHSHQPYLGTHRGALMLNPGSPTDRRRAPRPSFALVTVGDTLGAEILYL
jgi:putative phosphoesterase